MLVSVGRRGRKYHWIELNTDFKDELSYEGLKRIADYLCDYYFSHPELAEAHVHVAVLGREGTTFLVLKESVDEVLQSIEEILRQKDSIAPWNTAVIPEDVKKPLGVWSYAGFLLHWKEMSWRDYCKHVHRAA